MRTTIVGLWVVVLTTTFACANDDTMDDGSGSGSGSSAGESSTSSDGSTTSDGGTSSATTSASESGDGTGATGGSVVCGDTTCDADSVCVAPCCGGAPPICIDPVDGQCDASATMVTPQECEGFPCQSEFCCLPGECTPPPAYCAPANQVDCNGDTCNVDDCFGRLEGNVLSCTCA